MYCILIDSTKKSYVPFLKFLLQNKPNNIEIIDYSNIKEIKWSQLSKYSYVVLLSRYAYINFAKLIEYCETNKPALAGLSTYWGVGFPYVTIFSKDTIKQISSSIDTYEQYFDDPLENLLANTYMLCTKCNNIKDLLSKSDEEIYRISSLNNITNLDSVCYLNHIDYTVGFFHNSIFVAFNDNDDKFIDFITEYHAGKKFIRYKQIPYRLEIGKQFFVVRNYHVGIISDKLIVFWDRDSSSWKKASSKFSKKISSYIAKNFATALDSTDHP